MSEAIAETPRFGLELVKLVQGVSQRVLGQGIDVLSRLMALAQDGDQRAYQTALKRCVPLAAAIARRRGVAADRVDDVVQDVLLTIHRALPTYDPARPFGAWLGAIAERRAIDALRSRGRVGARETFDEFAYLAAPDPGTGADMEFLRGEDALRLRAAIAKLPPGQRQAIEILALKQVSLDDAANETGRNKVALKVNLHRAIKALRGLMEGENG